MRISPTEDFYVIRHKATGRAFAMYDWTEAMNWFNWRERTEHEIITPDGTTHRYVSPRNRGVGGWVT